VLTGFGSRASKRSLIVRLPMSGPVPCSGARRLGKGLDVVSTAIHGGEAAVNDRHHQFIWWMALLVETVYFQ